MNKFTVTVLVFFMCSFVVWASGTPEESTGVLKTKGDEEDDERSFWVFETSTDNLTIKQSPTEQNPFYAQAPIVDQTSKHQIFRVIDVDHRSTIAGSQTWIKVEPIVLSLLISSLEYEDFITISEEWQQLSQENPSTSLEKLWAVYSNQLSGDLLSLSLQQWSDTELLWEWYLEKTTSENSFIEQWQIFLDTHADKEEKTEGWINIGDAASFADQFKRFQ